MLDKSDNRIDVTYGQDESFENMRTVSASPEQEPGSSANYIQAVIYEEPEHLLDVEYFGSIIYEGDAVYGKSALQGRKPVKPV